MRLSKITLPLLAIVAAGASAMTLEDLSPGKTVCGPNLTLKDMKGKVVFVNYWGTH